MTSRIERTPFRQCLGLRPDESVIYAVDVLGAPRRDRYVEWNPLVYMKCARGLPMSRKGDIVLLIGSPDMEYLSWLRSAGLAQAEFVSYERTDSERSIAELVLDNPSPVQKSVVEQGRKFLFVPFYPGEAERRCAEMLGARFFGSQPEVCMKYFQKHTFKDVCRSLHIPTVGGVTAPVQGHAGFSDVHLEEIVRALLSSYPTLIIRGVDGAGGFSAYKTDKDSVKAVCDKVVQNRDEMVLIEPMLQVIASPNDQWAIDATGTIRRVGLSAQLFNELEYAGNVRGQYFSERIFQRIMNDSYAIAQAMARDGYIGIFGIDYIVTDDGIFPIENNARINGSTHTFAIVDELAQQVGPVTCWKVFNARSPERSFTGLRQRLGRLLYDGSRMNAVFPYDTDGLSRHGTCAIILLGEDMYHLDYLEKALSYIDIVRA